MNSSGISTAISETVSEMMVKPISPAPFSAAWSGGFALLDVARDVLDHDDRVVDDEAGGDGQRHQRQVVELKPNRYMPPSVPTSDSGTARLGMSVARTLRRNTKITARPARPRAPARIRRRAPTREWSSCGR